MGVVRHWSVGNYIKEGGGGVGGGGEGGSVVRERVTYLHITKVTSKFALP